MSSKQYRIVFKGELLGDETPASVMSRAAQRLKASPEQIERLFSGRPVTLKRGLSIDAAARYTAELRQLGMRARVEQEQSAEPDSSATTYRISYAGQWIEGFEREAVMDKAAQRLHASATQIALLFSGKKATLKKGLDARTAKAYAFRLQEIGMLVSIDPESTTPVETQAPAPAAPLPATDKVVEVSAPAPSAPAFPGRADTLIHTPQHEAEAASSHSYEETLIHTPLARATELLQAATTQVDFDFTQTSMDQEFAASNMQNRPDLEKTMIASPAILLAHMPGHAADIPEALSAQPAPPPSYRIPARQPDTQPPLETQSTVEMPAGRVCMGCGARQTKGKYCVHCGQEFLTVAHPKPFNELPQPATLIEASSTPAQHGQGFAVRLLMTAAVLLLVFGVGWIMLH